MVKTVVTSAEVPHIFCNVRRDVRTRTGHFRIEGDWLYSYRTPIAFWVGDLLLISSNRYSVTTSAQQSALRDAARHLESLELPDARIIVETRFTVSTVAAYIVARVQEMDDIQDKMTRMRSGGKKSDAIRQLSHLENVCAVVWNRIANQKGHWQLACKVHAAREKADAIARYTQGKNDLEAGLERAGRMLERCRAGMVTDAEQPEKAVRWSRQIWRLEVCQCDIRRIDQMSAARGMPGENNFTASATFAHAAKIMGKQWASECVGLARAIEDFAESLSPEIAALRAEYDRFRDEEERFARRAWLSGKSDRCPAGSVILRVVGSEVQTSQGARVPLSDALILAGLAQACRESAREMTLRGRLIGPYRCERINPDGTLIVGCHTIPFDAIADCLERHKATQS